MITSSFFRSPRRHSLLSLFSYRFFYPLLSPPQLFSPVHSIIVEFPNRYAFSKSSSVLVWMILHNSTKVVRFQMKTHYCDLIQWCSEPAHWCLSDRHPRLRRKGWSLCVFVSEIFIDFFFGRLFPANYCTTKRTTR